MRRSLLTSMVIVFLAMGRVLAVGLTIDGSRRFQVVDGFGVNINVASWNGGELRPALDMLVDDLGATIFRIIIDNADWEATNDNANPDTYNWTYYHGVYSSAKFEEYWATLAYLNQKGITAGAMINFMGPVAAWMGRSHIDTDAEDEWVEMIASFIHYARKTRNLQFGMLSPMNEPDWDGIEGPQVDATQYVRVMRKLSQKPDADGLQAVRLVGPDVASIHTGVANYLPEMLDDSILMAKVDHFAFHNYIGDGGGADGAIKASAYPDRNFWITEVTNNVHLMAHLDQGPAALLVWDAYDAVYNHALIRDPGNTDPPNDQGNGPPLLAYDQGTRTYTPRKGFYENMQLFKYVVPGSVRVAATESSSALTVYAFYDSRVGSLTIVGRNEGGDLTLNGTIAANGAIAASSMNGTLRFYLTDGFSTNMERGADVQVTGGVFTARVDANSVFTLTNASATTPPPPTPPPPPDTVPPAPPTNLRVVQIQAQ